MNLESVSPQENKGGSQNIIANLKEKLGEVAETIASDYHLTPEELATAAQIIAHKREQEDKPLTPDVISHPDEELQSLIVNTLIARTGVRRDSGIHMTDSQGNYLGTAADTSDAINKLGEERRTEH